VLEPAASIIVPLKEKFSGEDVRYPKDFDFVLDQTERGKSRIPQQLRHKLMDIASATAICHTSN
jgi:hypothetical protein